MEKLNTAWLTDLTFQFAQAEGVLERQHKLFAARELAAIAAAAAAETRDKDSLDRLAKLAAKLGDKDLASKIEAATQAAAKKPSTLPALLVNVDNLTPGNLAAYKEFIRAVRVDKILGDRAAIERRLTAFKKIADMPKELLERATLVANESMSAIPASAKMSGAATSLQQLLDYRDRLRMEAKKS